MILAAGLSPAWQQVLVFDRFTLGSVNRAAEAYWCASGKVVNVGVALHRLCQEHGGETLTLAPLGGAAYDAIDHDLAAIGLACQWVQAEAPTRICTTIVDRSTEQATELAENTGPMTSTELSQFKSDFASAAANASVVVLTGSLPAQAPTDYFRQLLEYIPCRAVLDCRGPELLACLDARPAVVKPNRLELSSTLGRPLEDDRDLKDAMRELQVRGAQVVVVTDGGGPTWVADDGDFYQIEPPPVTNIVNAIGCGDCMAAGIAWSLSQEGSAREAVQTGLEVAAKNLQTLLPSDFDGRRQRLCRR